MSRLVSLLEDLQHEATDEYLLSDLAGLLNRLARIRDGEMLA